MRHLRTFMIVAVCAAAAAGCESGTQASSEADRLVFPDPANMIWVVRQVPSTGDMPLGERMPETDPLAAKILAELRLPFHRSVIKLNQCARNLARRAPGPNVLFLSKDEGGFPRHGLGIRDEGNVRDYPDLNYVDLVIDAERLARGDLSIYSHELGHVMMMNVGPGLPERESVLQHVSMGVTDYATAFNEGWGEHFQRLAFEGVPLYAKAFQDRFTSSRVTANLWHSNIDEELRINGVLENVFVWQKVLPVEETAGLSPEEVLLLHHTSPLFDHARLKNGQQMLSCEGVMATLFYRINTSRALEGRYAPAAFYAPFLVRPLPQSVKPKDVFSPFENVMLKNFWIWSRMKERNAGGDGKPPFLIFLEEWIKTFPEDREELLRIVLSTTAGMTAGAAPGRLFEKASLAGLVGDYGRFMPAAAEYGKSLESLISGVLAGSIGPGAALGPELWVENKDFTVRTTLWVAENKRPLRVNLNTCSTYELMTFPGVTAVKARAIIAARDKAGSFSSMEEARRAGFTLTSL